MSRPSPFEPIGNRDHHSLLESSRRPVLFYFHDPENNLCQLINPAVEAVCEQRAPSVEYYSITTSEQKDLTYQFRVMEAPSFVLYYREEEVRRLTSIDYDDQFEEDFREFLVGDFLFAGSDLNRVEEMNFFSVLREWYQVNLVAFMSPADPINWQLEPILSTLVSTYPNYLRTHVVNTNSEGSLLTHYKLDKLPALLMMKETDVIKKWHPATNPDVIRNEITDYVENQMD